jgi:hypothetical protein
MPEANSLYRALGVAPSATAAEIKQAYRHKAKSAHPDAGGSVAAMAHINEAYQILSDPGARRAYDQAETPAPVQAEAHHPEPHTRPAAQDQASAAAHRAEAAAVERGRVAWARNSAWELLRICAPLAIAAVIATRLFSGHVTDIRALLTIDLITFIPVYGLILSIIFLNDPPLRLVFADLARRYHTTKHERMGALALILAFFPLAALWALWR